MHNFFITGLPRSRTTWFSVFFTNGNSYCFHELSNNHKDSYGIREELMNRPEEYKGISDCLIPYYYQPLADTLQEHRLVIIDRDFDDVVVSMVKYLNITDVPKLVESLEDLQKQINIIKGNYEHRVFKFTDLDNPEVIEDLWYYCVPGVNFDRQRYDMLNIFKIEPHLEKYLPNLKYENVKEIMGVV